MAKSNSHPLLPLVILVIFLCFAALIGYAVYSVAADVAAKAAQKMEEKNISLSKEGIRVQLKEVKEEDYVGKTQGLLVKAWNLSTWPAYKSMLWNKQQAETKAQGRGSVSGASSGYKKTS